MISSVENNQHMISGINFQGNSARKQPQASEKSQSQSSDLVNISRSARHLSAVHEKNNPPKTNETDLSPEEKKEVENLKKTDQKVKAHERAHMAAGADLIVGGANYQYQTGPDGKMYAVSGEVKIDTSKERNPQDTISKMQRVRRAALAPSQPSSTDRKVAAEASQTEAQARAELLKEKKEKEENDSSEKESVLVVEFFKENKSGELIDISV